MQQLEKLVTPRLAELIASSALFLPLIPVVCAPMEPNWQRRVQCTIITARSRAQDHATYRINLCGP